MTASYLDLHVLQSIPFANLNRDDLGSPKTVFYGGGTRTRVSSQCWKRAVRLAMEGRLGDPAMRTRRLARRVAMALRDAGWDEELAAFAGGQVVAAAQGKKPLELEDTGDTSVLLYMPRAAIGRLAALCEEHREALTEAAQAAPAKGKKKGQGSVLPTEAVNEIVTSRNGIITLFGRMLAELPGGRVDGAVQVAHAFTTHVTEPEVDFFTAVDDVEELATDAGSGHMNAAEFSAGVFYRYASVNIAELLGNLDGDDRQAQARELVEAFATAFIESLPQAKKNSTAPFTVPDLVYLAVRRDRPVSLASAFEAPVRPAPDGGCAEPSRRRLADHAAQVYRLIGTDGLAHHAYAGIDDKEHPALGTSVPSFRELVTGGVAAAFGEENAS